MSDVSVKVFENFLKLNKLELSRKSASEFADLYDIDVDVLAEDYIEYSTLFTTKSVRIKYLKKACIINPNNYISKILLYDLVRDIKTNTVDTTKYGLDDLGIIKYSAYLEEEAKRVLADLKASQIIKDEDLLQCDICEKGYKARGYLWVLKRLYLNYIEEERYELASMQGESVIAMNPKDNMNVLSSLPYLYISMGNYNEAELLLTNLAIDKIEYHLVKAMILYHYKKYDELINELAEVKRLNPFVLEFIVLDFDSKTTDKLSNSPDDSYSYGLFLYYNASIADKELKSLREFILDNIEI